MTVISTGNVDSFKHERSLSICANHTIIHDKNRLKLGGHLLRAIVRYGSEVSVSCSRNEHIARTVRVTRARHVLEESCHVIPVSVFVCQGPVSDYYTSINIKSDFYQEQHMATCVKV